MNNQLCTIGFSKKSLQKFTELLKESNVTRLVDTRLNNTSQLSGFAKKQDLEFVMGLVGIDYTHEISLAPTDEILTAYKKKQMSWNEYEDRYIDLLHKRKVENNIAEIMKDETTCFLCSEEKPHYCHRRLLAEYIKERNPKIKIIHLV